ncbi:MAG: 6-phosphofructokinase [Marmoricola sp.]
MGDRLASEIERQRTGKESRAVVLGHVQRGGTLTTAFDRWLATRFGLAAIASIHEGDFGKMMALRGTDIVRVPLAMALANQGGPPSCTPKLRCSSTERSHKPHWAQGGTLNAVGWTGVPRAECFS